MNYMLRSTNNNHKPAGIYQVPRVGMLILIKQMQTDTASQKVNVYAYRIQKEKI